MRMSFYLEMYGVVEALIMDQETGQVRPDLAKGTKWMCLGCKDGQGYRMQREAYHDIKHQILGGVNASGWWATVAAGDAGPPRRVRRSKQDGQAVAAAAPMHAHTAARAEGKPRPIRDRVPSLLLVPRLQGHAAKGAEAGRAPRRGVQLQKSCARSAQPAAGVPERTRRASAGMGAGPRQEHPAGAARM